MKKLLMSFLAVSCLSCSIVWASWDLRPEAPVTLLQMAAHKANK